jgi:hypothetical protein
MAVILPVPTQCAGGRLPTDAGTGQVGSSKMGFADLPPSSSTHGMPRAAQAAAAAILAPAAGEPTNTTF